MYSIIQNLPPELQFVLALVGIVSLFGFAVVVACIWGQVRRLQIEADFKSDLIERGLSVEEIREVLMAPMRGKRRHEVQAELTSKLAETGLDAGQIKHVLEAGKPYWLVTPPKGCKNF